MRTKHWLPLLSSFVAASIIVACGSDDSAPTGGAGAHSGGAGGAHAGASSTAGTGGAHAGAPSGGSTSAGAPSGGAGIGGASAGAGDVPNDAGAAGTVEEGGTGGTAAAGGGAGGATAGGGAGGAAGGATGGGGAGGSSGGAGGGSGGVAGVNLCDRNNWKYTFQFCPRTAAFGSGVNQPTFAVDGDVTTFVTSGKAQDGTFFALIDLHGAANVSSLIIDYGTGQADSKDGDSSDVAVKGSDDGVTFADIAGSGTASIANHKITVTIPPGVTHRYLKVLQIQKPVPPANPPWWALPEINLTCTSNGVPAVPPVVVGPVARANWKVATPNSACSDVNIAQVLDGVLTTQWQSVGQPGIGYWLRVDLGAALLVSNVDFKVGVGTTDFPAKVKLQTSVDDITYVDVKTTGVTGVDTKIVLDAPVTTRFFRIVSEADTTGGSWWSIGELDVNVP